MKKFLTATVLSMVSFISDASVLPEVPVPFKSGTGVIDKNTVYIGLGSAGTAWYKIDIQSKNKKWVSLAEFPGGAREQSTSVFINDNIYVFGGVGKNKQGLTQVFNDVHMYKPESNTWIKLMSHAPLGMAGNVAFAQSNTIFIIGGVNQNIFNGYFEDLNDALEDKNIISRINHNYFGKKIEDYLFSKTLLSFEPSSQQWGFAGESPWFGTAGATAVNNGKKTYLINGEVKPGLRTDSVFEVDFSERNIKWRSLCPVYSPDGVAGGFAGMSNGNLIFTGGAGFKGSREAYDSGRNYAHEGLTKFYSSDIYVMHEGKWHKSGELPVGRAYGVSLPWNNGLLIIGGETSGGKAVADSIWITADKTTVKIQ